MDALRFVTLLPAPATIPWFLLPFLRSGFGWFSCSIFLVLLWVLPLPPRTTPPCRFRHQRTIATYYTYLYTCRAHHVREPPTTPPPPRSPAHHTPATTSLPAPACLLQNTTTTYHLIGTFCSIPISTRTSLPALHPQKASSFYILHTFPFLQTHIFYILHVSTTYLPVGISVLHLPTTIPLFLFFPTFLYLPVPSLPLPLPTMFLHSLHSTFHSFTHTTDTLFPACPSFLPFFPHLGILCHSCTYHSTI